MEAKGKFRQIFGTETEWPISVRLNNSAEFVQLDIKDAYQKFLMEYLPESLISTAALYSSATSANFLSNGSRYYNDVGSRLEYATPEDVSVESVVLSEDAGEWIVAEGLRRYVAENDNIAEGFFCRRVDGIDRRTWGYHINVGEDRKWLGGVQDVQFHTRPLLTHLAASLPMFGGGSVYRTESGEYEYSFGQKVVTPIYYDYATSTTLERQKPIISLRDEPLSNSEQYNRLHIVGMDSHISPWAKRMTIGTISLVLLACREGHLRGMALDEGGESAARAMRKIAVDMDMKKKFHVERDKKSRTIFDIENEIIEAVEKTEGRTTEQDKLLEEWKAGFNKFRNDPDGLLESDAILKRMIVKRDMDRRGKNHPDARSRYIDMMYTAPLRVTKKDAQNMTTDQLLADSFSGKTRRKYFAQDKKYEDRLKDRILYPPKTTRAYRRGNEIREKRAKWNDWNSYSALDVNGQYGKSVNTVKDPFDGAIEDEYLIDD